MTKFTRALLVATAALILCPAAPVAAQSNTQGETEGRIGMVRRIEFRGLRRVSAATVRARIATRIGQPLDPKLVEADVRVLGGLGWFDTVSAEVEVMPLLFADASRSRAALPFAQIVESDASPELHSTAALRLIFVVEELPYLAGVEFLGSRELNSDHINELLAKNAVRLQTARPVNRTALFRAARAIENALADRGYARAHATVELVNAPGGGAVRAMVFIDDGPRISVSRVVFDGNEAFSDKKLRAQMQRVAPHVWFAGLRDKDVHTDQRLAEDIARLGDFYRNHGFPQARIGQPRVELVEEKVRSWFPWPGRKTEKKLRIFIPVEEGTFFRLENIKLEGPRLEDQDGVPQALGEFKPLEPYSEEKIERARQALLRTPLVAGANGEASNEVEAVPHFDPQSGTARVILRARPAETFVVRRLHFTGHHRFNDRFYRRRIRIQEGEPFDAIKLEKGLSELAASGWIQPVTPEKIELKFDEAARAVDITVHLEEIGRQRVSFSGGAAGLGSPLGVAYNVFSLFGGEELITGHIGFGGSTFDLAVSLTKEGLLGTPGSFGWSVYRQVVSPRMPGAQDDTRLFTSRSRGFTQSWTHRISPAACVVCGSQTLLSGQYQFAQTATSVSNDVAAPSAGTRRSSIGGGWTHLTQRAQSQQQLSFNGSFAGGSLGGSEDWLRTSAEYARLQADPLSNGRNAWAARGFMAGITSHSGAALPLHERFFAGEQFVRGARSGELTPYATVQASDGNGGTATVIQPTGANLVAAANTEYRVPIGSRAAGVHVAAFADAGAAWLLPRWLGGEAPDVLAETNGALRASTGLELRWTLPHKLGAMPVPLAGETLRLHYAVNPLALVVHSAVPVRRRSAVGWALGSMF